MLNQKAFANSLGVLSGLAYLVFFVLSLFWPNFFKLIFNAQFFGADVASLLPQSVSVSSGLLTLAGAVLVGWSFGYVWAWLYNEWAK